MPRVLFLAAFAVLQMACATRSVPLQTSRNSAASATSTETSPAVLTTSLTSDPPLPGEPNTGWAGLESGDGAGADSGDPHRGHRGHGGRP